MAEVCETSEKRGTKAANMFKSADSIVKCFQCDKRVYEMEKIVADQNAYHKTCFRCAHCNRVLSLGNYATGAHKLYCKPHFISLFKVKGNYDEGFQSEPPKFARNTDSKDDKTAGSANKHSPADDGSAAGDEAAADGERARSITMASAKSIFERTSDNVSSSPMAKKTSKWDKPKPAPPPPMNRDSEEDEPIDPELPPASYTKSILAKFQSLQQTDDTGTFQQKAVAVQESSEESNHHHVDEQSSTVQQGHREDDTNGVHETDEEDVNQQEILEQEDLAEDIHQHENLEREEQEDVHQQENLEQEDQEDIHQQENLEQEDQEDVHQQENLEQEDVHQLENLEQEDQEDVHQQENLGQEDVPQHVVGDDVEREEEVQGSDQHGGEDDDDLDQVVNENIAEDIDLENEDELVTGEHNERETENEADKDDGYCGVSDEKESTDDVDTLDQGVVEDLQDEDETYQDESGTATVAVDLQGSQEVQDESLISI